MAEQNTGNRPTGTYTPTVGNTSGVDNSPTQGGYAQRMMPVPPMTSGPNAGITPITQTPEGTPHTADKD